MLTNSLLGSDRTITNQELENRISLEGKWECYGKILDIDKLNARIPVEVDFPSLWTGQVVGRDTLWPQGYATYRLVLHFEEPHPETSLMLEDMYTSYRLYANREVIATNGVVANNPEDYKPYWEPQVVDLPADTNQVELILQIANYEHSKGGIKEPILLGESGLIKEYDLERKAYALILTGGMIVGGLFFIGLYWFGRHDLSMFYFSMFSLVYLYRIVGTDYYVLQQIIKGMSWNLGVHLEYLSLALSLFFVARYFFNLYPKEVNPTVDRIISGVCLGIALTVLITPPIFFTRLVFLQIAITVMMIVYGVWISVRAFKHNRSGSKYNILSIGVVFGVALVTIGDYLRLVTVSETFFFVGYITFFFSQSLILSYRFSTRLKHSVQFAEQANETKQQFLSTISHELRTPLNAIGGLTRLLSDNDPRPDQVNHLRSIRFSANNLTALVTDILDFSKIEKGEVKLDHSAFLLEDVFNQVIINYRSTAAEKGLKLSYEIDEHFKGLKVRSDQTRLNQVVNNLMSNAIKFTKEGYVSIKAEWLEESVDEVKFVVEVEDTGVGIPQDKLEDIFYQFTQISQSSTREYGGTGLGLAIVRNILTAMGSKVTVASTQGEGSRFSFQLTLLKEKRKKSNESYNRKKGKPADFKKKRVMVVEDDLMNAMITEKYLNKLGINPALCSNGKEAIELFDKEKFDLILMDMHMPVMDGYQASKYILKKSPDQKIIALTASVTGSSFRGLHHLGFESVLSKPFRKQDLLDEIVKLLSY